MTSESKKRGPMREWAAPSYDPRSGRAAASSMEPRASYSFDGQPCHPSRQISATLTPGQGGAPGISAMNKSGSADPGRQIYNRETRPAGPPGGRHDDEHPSRRER
jgi:hypothetical protein